MLFSVSPLYFIYTLIKMGNQPWLQHSVGNKDHTDAAVVIIGAGISGELSMTPQQRPY